MNDRTPCAVTSDLNRYLNSLDEDEARERAIQDQAQDLLDDEYSPSDLQNIMEALGELTEEVIGDVAMNLRNATRSDQADIKKLCYQITGQHLHSAVIDYWTKRAKAKATENVAQSCRNCFGRGCRRCEEP